MLCVPQGLDKVSVYYIPCSAECVISASVCVCVSSLPLSLSVCVCVCVSALDVGRSCILVSLGGKNVMLDCGMHMGFNDEVRSFYRFLFSNFVCLSLSLSNCLSVCLSLPPVFLNLSDEGLYPKHVHVYSS